MKRLKKVLLVLAGCIGLLLVVLAATPLWFPWVFKPVAKRYGLTIQNYNRFGYSRFEATGVVFSNRNVVVKADRVEAFTPPAWLWQLWLGDTRMPVIAHGWDVTARASSSLSRRTGRGPPSTYTIVRRVDKVFIVLRKWLPSTELTNGTVNAPGLLLEIPNARWRDGVVSGAALDTKRHIDATVRGTVGKDGFTAVDVVWNSLNSTSRLVRISARDNLRFEGTIDWLTNRIKLEAEFATTGRLPQRATLTAPDFSFPANMLRVRGYEALKGNASVQWEQNSFKVECSALAHPQTNMSVPPLNIDVRASGNTNGATIETVHITSSFVNAELSEPVSMRYRPPFLNESVTVKASINLDQQQWVPAKGQISTRALVFASTTKYPAVNFELSGTGIQFSNVPLRAATMVGEFRWPRLVVPSATVDVFDTTRVKASAEINIEGRSIVDASVDLQSVSEPGLLPRGLTVSNVVLSANLKGPFKALTHRGKLKADTFQASMIQPLAVSAEWQAHHLNFTNVVLHASGPQTSTVTARLAADVGTPTRLIHLHDLIFATNGHDVVRMVAPATATISRAGQTNGLPSISVSPLHMTGDCEISVGGIVQWPAYGRLTNSVRNFDPRILDPLVHTRPMPGRIDRLDIGAAWSNGPVAFTMDAVGRAFVTNAGEIRLNARAAGNDAGITIHALSLSSEVAPGLTGEGVLPMTIHPQRGIVLRENETLNVRFSTFPDAVVWNAIAARFGISMKNPNVSALLGGSWKEPHGRITAAIQEMSLSKTNRPLPTLENVEIAIDVSRDRVALSRGHVEVERRPIELTGEMPLGEAFWDSVVKKKARFDWKQVKAHLVVPQTELQPFASFLPEMLAPQGRFNADLRLSAGEVNGVVRVQDLRTHPLPSLGPVRDLDIRARFEGQRINLQPVDATIGGRRVRGEGTVYLPPNLIPRDELPPFDLRLRGANVPLVRRPEAIIRADLELEMTNSPTLKAPEVKGAIVMRKSYFLSDLEDLVPGKVAGPRRRPPYFSITNERLADWHFAVDVRGKEFLKIRSPLFRGSASATLRVEGTLRDPTALGEVRIDKGRILFPFATLEVQQGFVTLSSEDPYRPHLNITASTRRIDYEIKVEITGPADNPIVQFSSSPPLSPEQIVLMVTAGQMPTETARLSTEQRAQRMAVFFGGSLLSEFGIGGDDEERLSVRSGEQVTETGAQTYEAEYKLRKDLSVVGEYDRFNDLNVGLKWRFYSR